MEAPGTPVARLRGDLNSAAVMIRCLEHRVAGRAGSMPPPQLVPCASPPVHWYGTEFFSLRDTARASQASLPSTL